MARFEGVRRESVRKKKTVTRELERREDRGTGGGPGATYAAGGKV